jgi:hypothetical protein
MTQVWSVAVRDGIRTTRRIIDVTIVLLKVSRPVHSVSVLEADTYIDPTPKIIVTPTFCFVGICRPQTVGMGIAINSTSVTTPSTAVDI